MGPFKRTSLAFDSQGGSYSMPYPASKLTFRPNQSAPQDRPPQVPRFQGLDTLTARRDHGSNYASFTIHVLVITAILWWGVVDNVHVATPQTEVVTPLHFTLYAPPPPPVTMPVAKKMGGGGGGDLRHVVPAPKIEVPKVVERPKLLAPQLATIEHPKLEVPPTSQVRMPNSADLPSFSTSTRGPQIALASPGAGTNAGLGHGIGGGIGFGQGSGVGPGSGGGYGGGIMNVGGGVSAPQVLHAVEPEFTDQARQANYQGNVTIHLIVDSQGYPQDIRVMHHLGMGLDEKAIAAVRQYRFRPAMFQGHPVSVQMEIEVEFHLH